MASMIWKFSFRAGTSSGGVDTAGIVLATAVVGLSFRQAGLLFGIEGSLASRI
jgi:hypothetical protein